MKLLGLTRSERSLFGWALFYLKQNSDLSEQDKAKVESISKRIHASDSILHPDGVWHDYEVDKPQKHGLYIVTLYSPKSQGCTVDVDRFGFYMDRMCFSLEVRECNVKSWMYLPEPNR